MTVGNESLQNEYCKEDDAEEVNAFKELAIKFVENIIKQATEEVVLQFAHNKCELLDENIKTPKPPSIQIDLVGSNSPSPDDSLIPWASNSEQRGVDDDSLDSAVETKEENSQSSNHNRVTNEELQSFALEYVKEIIAKATALASERAAARNALNSEASSGVHNQGRANMDTPWYIRLRQLVTRLMRETCFCKSKNERRADL